MRYEVSIKSTYVPTWGLKEAFREFGSNAFDAESEMGASASIRYRKENETVYIENNGVTVPREALLFGHTTKSDNEELIGQFGEGLKLACLAAVREGHKVRIRSGAEVWVPSMVSSKVFPGTEVLGFDIASGRKAEDRVQVELVGVSPEQWEEFRQMFLKLDAPKADEIVKTWDGALLKGPRYIGKVFVKGVLVERDSKLQYGYDLRSAKVDRDRNIVNTWDKEYAMREIWSAASRELPEMKKQFVKSLFSQDADLSGINEHNAAYVDRDLALAAAEHFREEYGSDAVPVASSADSDALQALGKKPIVVSKSVAAVVQRAIGTTTEIKQKLQQETVREYSMAELLDSQRVLLDLATKLLSKVAGLNPDNVMVVDFRSSELEEQFRDEKHLIASKVLGNWFETLRVLIHSIAKGDSKEVGRIWCAVMTEKLKEVSA